MNSTKAASPEIQRKPTTMQSETTKTFLAGGIAGCCAKTVVAPFDRIKILLQAHNNHYKHLGVFSTLKSVIVKEGVVGLFQGNGVQMIRVFPYAAIQFLSYEKFKKLAKIHFHDHLQAGKLLSGSLAGMCAVLCTYPLDVIRARLAFQVKGELIYSGLIDVVKSIFHIEGKMAFFKGIQPTLLGMVPYAGLSFYSFESLKEACLEYFPEYLGKPCPQNTGGVVLIVPAKVVCGGLAGAFAQTVSYPLDVVRRKMQVSRMLPESHKYDVGWYRILCIVYKEDGIVKGLFRGMSVNYIRAMPMVATSFTVYELVKQWLGLDTGVDNS